MRLHLEAGELHLTYIPKFREYGIEYRESFGGGRQVIKHCPWCGKRLPDSLRTIWFEELDQLGLDPDDDLPDSLLTEAWWRAAGR